MAVSANLTVGQVLTADIANTYMLNSGLVFVKQQTIGSGVASVTVSDAFSATYDNYRILIAGFGASATVASKLQLSNSTSTTYATSGWIYQYGTVALVSESATAQTGSLIGHTNSAGKTSTIIEVQSPFLSQVSTFSGATMSSLYGDDRRSYDSSTNSSTGFVFSALSGTLTGGIITVYGYRKA
jgi:hypothetical protein